MAKTTTPKASFKRSLDDFRTILKSIREGAVKNIYLLMGEESYFIDRISDTFATTLLTEEERGFNQTILYGKDVKITDMIELCRSYPMVGSRNLVILKEAQSAKGMDDIVHYLKSPQPQTTLILCFKEGNMDKRSALYKKIKSVGEVFESVAPRDYEIGGWIRDFYRSKGYTIDDKALVMITEQLGASMTKVVNESEKMFVRLGSTIKSITADNIEDNIGISKDYNIFELNKALSERDLQKALRICDHFGRNPKEHPFVVTINMLFTHFLRIFSLGIIIWQSKKKRVSPPPEMELSKMLKLPNPYFLKEYNTALRSYPTNKSYMILSLIREYDMKSKGVEAGNSSESELLKELIFKIFTI